MNAANDLRNQHGVDDRKLRIFVAAGEQLSFTTAGRMLGISQPAVSHAIRALEAALGADLFHRERNQIALTPPALQLLHRVRSGFDVIDAAAGDFRATADASQLVTLSVGSALATYWLLPRLANFRARYPATEIAVVTRDTDHGVGGPAADLWIPLGLGQWPDLTQWQFAEERIIPVAAPSVASVLEDTTNPASLLDTPLLHNDERYKSRFDWHRWFTHHNVDPGPTLPGQRSNDYSVVLHAALSGQGVALGWLHVVQPLLDNGSLVAIHGPPVETDHAFLVLARRGALRRSAVDELRRWLLTDGNQTA